GRAGISLRLGARAEHTDDADAGGDQAEAGDDEDHENAEQIAPEIKLAGAYEPAHFGCRGGFAADEMHDEGEEEENEASAHRADEAGAHAKPHEMALELAADEALVGADEMQHLDDLAVRRHGAPRCRH